MLVDVFNSQRLKDYAGAQHQTVEPVNLGATEQIPTITLVTARELDCTSRPQRAGDIFVSGWETIACVRKVQLARFLEASRPELRLGEVLRRFTPAKKEGT